MANDYGPEHRKLRATWKPIVATGTVNCHAVVCIEPERRIQPDDTWDLGHTRDGTAWTGPEHRSCNRSDGRRPHGDTKPTRWKL